MLNSLDKKKNTLLIVDFGSQYTQLIARRIRELQVYCVVKSHGLTEAELSEIAPAGIILSGGPECVNACNAPEVPHYILEAGVPILGICYGMQVMVKQLGGAVESSAIGEFGYAAVSFESYSELSKDFSVGTHTEVWMSHQDRVTWLPAEFSKVASSAQAEYAVIADEERKRYGIQFHPEVTHTPEGMKLLRRFAYDICACAPVWTPEAILEDLVEKIRIQVGEERVLVALSGGVDSAVTAALIHKAIGAQLVCVFVDTGLMRFQEAEEVQQLFAEYLGVSVHTVQAKERFFQVLQGVEEPEEKRKRIGETFVRVFEDVGNHLDEPVQWLGQGTIYPDVIESAQHEAGSAAQVIKSHHNVGGLPERMDLKLLEPVRMLFKDEVRKVGECLGLPQKWLHRHPFPGPGLALRQLGAVRPEYIDIVRQADHIFITALREYGLYETVSQAFAVFLPVRSVGVKGDARCYAYVIALRAVKSTDFMTANWSRLMHDFLSVVSSRILNKLIDVSRVVYDISDKPPATIEWE